MFSFFKIGSNSSDEEAKKRPKRFFTQDEMIKNYNASATKENQISRGLCGPLTNKWMEDRIKALEPNFLNDEKETCQVGLDYLKQQEEMRSKGGIDMRHIGFYNTKIKYNINLTETEPLKTAEGVKVAVSGSRFTLLAYPMRNNKSHMVGFENDNGQGECRLFDVNMYLGQTKGKCAELQELLAMSIDAYGANTDEKSYVVNSRP